MCGVLTGVQRKRNREQKPWAAVVLEDRDGSVEGLVFATAFERLAKWWWRIRRCWCAAWCCRRRAARRRSPCRTLCRLTWRACPCRRVISIRVWLGRNGADKAEAMETLFRRKPGDTQVRLRLEMARNFAVILDVPMKVRPDREFRAELEKICGEGAMETLAQ